MEGETVIVCPEIAPGFQEYEVPPEAVSDAVFPEQIT